MKSSANVDALRR